MIQSKLQELGFVFSNSVVNGASYIMTDGTFLNVIQASEDGLLEKRHYKSVIASGHNEFNDFLRNQLFEEQTLVESDFAVRINDGKVYDNTPYITIPHERLTNQQVASLRLWVETLKPSGGSLLVGYENDRKMLELNLIENSTDLIINRIRCLYESSQDTL